MGVIDQQPTGLVLDIIVCQNIGQHAEVALHLVHHNF